MLLVNLFPAKRVRPLVVGVVSLALIATLLIFTFREDTDSYIILQNHGEGTSPTGREQAGWVYALTFSPDGTLLASGQGRAGQWGQCRVWDVAGRRLRAVFQASSAISAAAFAPDGRTLAMGSYEGSIQLWDRETGQQRRFLERNQDRILALAYSPDGMVLAGGTTKGVVLWDRSSGQERATLPGQAPLAFSPDGRTLATARPGAAGAQLWDVRAGQVQGDLQEPASAHMQCLALAFSPDGKTLATGDSDFTVRVWDVERQRLRTALRWHADHVGAVAFSPDGRILASGGVDRTIRLWNAQTGRQEATLQGHTGAIYCMAFAPDGRWLASGGFDQTVRLWDVAKALGGANP